MFAVLIFIAVAAFVIAAGFLITAISASKKQEDFTTYLLKAALFGFVTEASLLGGILMALTV